MASALSEKSSATSDRLNDRISPNQCRAARGLLDWSQEDLSRESGISRGTVKKIESGKSLSPVHASVLRRTLEDAGCVFLDEGATVEGAPVSHGVALRG